MLGAKSTFIEFVSESQTRSFFGDELGANFIGYQWFNGIANKKDPTLKEVIENLEIMMDKIQKEAITNLEQVEKDQTLLKQSRLEVEKIFLNQKQTLVNCFEGIS